jgi:soluble lytic murein transglycosylase-like protein
MATVPADSPNPIQPARPARTGTILTRLLAVALVLVLGMLGSPSQHAAASLPAPQQEAPPRGSISPYWRFEVQQWETQIVRYAEERHVDPDLVAALIWKESGGLSWAHSASGAVGLMQVMPSDMGFVHRPTSEQLFRPSTNIYWGTGILTEIIAKANGDLFTALAAYNGGWYQTWKDIPRGYSREVMTLYAEAVAVRNGYENPAINEWGLVVDIQGRNDVDFASSPEPGWLLTSHITGPRATLGRPAIGAVVFSSTNTDGHPWRITMWLLPNA